MGIKILYSVSAVISLWYTAHFLTIRYIWRRAVGRTHGTEVLFTNPSRFGYCDFTMDSAVAKYLKKIGRKGGSVRSKAKAEAARANGKKGGRPRKDGKR